MTPALFPGFRQSRRQGLLVLTLVRCRRHAQWPRSHCCAGVDSGAGGQGAGGIEQPRGVRAHQPVARHVSGRPGWRRFPLGLRAHLLMFLQPPHRLRTHPNKVVTACSLSPFLMGEGTGPYRSIPPCHTVSSDPYGPANSRYNERPGPYSESPASFRRSSSQHLSRS